MTDLVVYGTGGFAREVHQVVEDLNTDGETWNVLGFLDDDASQEGATIHGLPVLGGRSWLAARAVAVALGIGGSAARWRLVADLSTLNGDIRFPTLVHPLAWIGNRIELGEGSIVCAGSLLTTDLKIGSHVILNLDCTVGHDSYLEDFATYAPSVNISGAVTVGEGCDVGTGASIIQGISIGSWTVIGAGAVVVRDLPSNVTAVGTPANRSRSDRKAGIAVDGPFLDVGSRHR